jgi:parvulin-like peptidyl-prolyl isomerase
MHLRSITRGFFLFCMLVMLYGCAKRDPVIAFIEGRGTISLEELKTEYNQVKGRKAFDKAEMSDLKEYLEDMIGRNLVTAAAYEKGLDKDSSVVAKMAPYKSWLLMKKLLDVEVINRVLPEKDFIEYYANMAKEVEISTIFFALRRDASAEQEKEVREKALQVLRRIKRKEDYAELAKAFSDDASSKPNGGYLGYITWDRSDEPIKQKAWAMREGEVSGLVRNNVGFHIIKVEDIRQKERKPFEEVRLEIDRQLRLERQSKLNEKKENYWKNLLIENDVKWDINEINNMLSCLKDVPQANCGMLRDTLRSRPPAEYLKTVISTYKDGETTIQGFVDKFHRNFTRWPADTNSVKVIVGQTVYMPILITNKALKNGLDREEDVAEKLTKTLELYMREVMINDEIYGEIDPTDEVLLDFYEKFKREKYLVEEKVNVQEIMVKKEIIANEIAVSIKKGHDFGKLAEQYTERKGYKKKKGELGYFRRGFWGVIGEKAFEMKEGEVLGPFALKEDDAFSIIKLLDREPEKITPFKELEKKIVLDYVGHTRKEREDAWINKRRENVRVIVYDDVLENAFEKK